MQRILAGRRQLLLAGSAVALLLWPSPATPKARVSGASGRCCFQVSVDSGGSYTDTYTGTKSPQWKGWAKGEWRYSERFIASYTGSGIQVFDPAKGLPTSKSSHLFGLVSQTSDSSSYHTVIFQRGESRPYTCQQADAGITPTFEIGYGLHYAASAKGVNGSRQLVLLPGLNAPHFRCPAIVGGPGETAGGLKKATDISVPAPSASSFRNGTSFGKSCWQSVSADLKATVPNHYEGSLWVSVQFTYFPPEQLDAKGKALLKLENHWAKDSAAATKAEAGALDSQDPNKPDSGCA